MKALVVDDDRVLADVLAFTLRREGFTVVQAFDGETALELWQAERPDLVVLDVNLPRLDGFSVCRRIRAQADTPILLLTVRNDEEDIIHGLGLGADDYITKPFSPRQLVARAQAILRRAGTRPAGTVQTAGDLNLDSNRRELRIAGGPAVTLTPLESQLLGHLMHDAGHVLNYEAIINRVWGAQGGDRDMLRQLIRRLRSKIGEACQDTPAEYIETVAGLGYGLVVHRRPEKQPGD